MGKRGRPRHPDILTPREWEVLALLREGLSNPDMAERLGISRDGVKFHVSEILTKLGVASREEAVSWSAERRPWWAAALTPVGLLWRKAGWAISGAVVLTAVAGLALLAFLLLRIGSGSVEFGPHQLAYSDASGSLWLLDADSGDKRELGHNPNCGFARLEWSPDGRTLACAGSQGETGGERITLFGVDRGTLGGFDARSLTDFSWSPTGAVFLYSLFPEPSGQRRFYLADAAGQSTRDLGRWDMRILRAWAAYGLPLWSPDGSQIVYRAADSDEVHIYNVDTATDDVWTRGYYPFAWALGGSALILAANYQPAATANALPSYEVILVAPDLSLQARLAALDNGVQFWVSPDGEHAVYPTRVAGLPGLGVVDLRTGDARPIANSPITYRSDYIPVQGVRFSGDGQSVYWVGGDNAGYRARIDGTGLTRLVEAPNALRGWFEFSPDLSMVAYYEFADRATGGDGMTLRVARADGTNARDIKVRLPQSEGFSLSSAWRP